MRVVVREAALSTKTDQPLRPMANSNFTVPAPSRQTLNGVPYVFVSWGHGGARTHAAASGYAAGTITAYYTVQSYQLTTSVSPAGVGTITPSSGWYAPNTVVQVTATANSGNAFSGFSGALSGTANPQNLTVTGPASVTANFGAASPALTLTASRYSQTATTVVFTVSATTANFSGTIGLTMSPSNSCVTVLGATTPQSRFPVDRQAARRHWRFRSFNVRPELKLC